MFKSICPTMLEEGKSSKASLGGEGAKTKGGYGGANFEWKERK